MELKAPSMHKKTLLHSRKQEPSIKGGLNL